MSPVFVSRFCHLTGALGSALILAENAVQKSGFRGLALHRENIPVENEVCELCHNNCKINKVIVGADRIAANGDAANKIGTYALAVLARAHRIPFYIAAPVSTFDFSIKTGEDIPIEERQADEVTTFRGAQAAPKGMKVYNPAFDVTPARLITAMITERGVLTPPFPAAIARLKRFVP